MLKRREFITGLGASLAPAAWPLAARAQPAERMRLVGILSVVGEDDSDFQERFAVFRQALEKAGWTEGRNLRFEQRSILADAERTRTSAAELVALALDVIVTNSNLATASASRQTKTIPIVFAVAGDPVGTGLVANMARPGGNVTGFAGYEFSLAGKWLELLKEVAPGVRRVAAIYSDGSGSTGLMRTAVKLAPSLGIQPTSIRAGDGSEIERAIDAFAAAPNSGMIVMPGPNTFVHRDRLIAAAARHRLPAIYASGRYYVTRGGLMTYAADTLDNYRRAAAYVDRILRGEKAGDLPVQAPTKYELVVNLKTAKALGLTIPESFLLRADEVIE